MNNEFYTFCESIWEKWLKDEDISNEQLNQIFQLEYCPEPYLSFRKANKESNSEIFYLTTNPGAGFEKQLKESALSNEVIIDSRQSYRDNSKRLADYYVENLKVGSKSRIDHMMYLATKCGYDSFEQIETIPFHSKALGDKNKVVNLMRNNELLAEYIDVLKKHLKNKNVISIQAVGDQKTKNLSDWIKLQCEIIDLNIDNSRYIPIVSNNGKDSVAFYIEKKEECIKVLCLRVGQNDLPSEAGCNIIADEFNKLK